MPVIRHDNESGQQHTSAPSFMADGLRNGDCGIVNKQRHTWFQALADQERAAARHPAEGAQMGGMRIVRVRTQSGVC